MYNNVGEKIKGLAKILGILSLLGGIVIGIIEFVCAFTLPATATESVSMLLGGIAFIIGGIVLFFKSWITNGFGQLVDDVHREKTTYFKN